MAIGKLRKALGDSTEKPQYIATVASRGYRLLTAVERIAAAENSPGQHPQPPAGGVVTIERSTRTIQAGQTVSHDRVLDIIGSGMGVVYPAEDVRLGRRVAIKFLPGETVADSRARQRFEREAQSASSLNHPSICTVYEFGEHDGQPFLVMELLQGQNLRDGLAAAQGEKELPLDSLRNGAIQISNGLQAAHKRGIIHRDIKPANIFLTDKRTCKILDFGLVKLLENSEPEAKTQDPSRLPQLGACGLCPGRLPGSFERNSEFGSGFPTVGYT